MQATAQPTEPPAELAPTNEPDEGESVTTATYRGQKKKK